MPRLFGTDGIRGVANRYPITPEIGLSLGRAIVRFYNKKVFIVTGRDTRLSGSMLRMPLSLVSYPMEEMWYLLE